MAEKDERESIYPRPNTWPNCLWIWAPPESPNTFSSQPNTAWRPAPSSQPFMAVLGNGTSSVLTLPPPALHSSDHRQLHFAPPILRSRIISGNTKVLVKSSHFRWVLFSVCLSSPPPGSYVVFFFNLMNICNFIVVKFYDHGRLLHHWRNLNCNAYAVNIELKSDMLHNVKEEFEWSCFNMNFLSQNTSIGSCM